jgi:hypothetical protein
MLHDLCNPLTMKIMALGRPLYEAERIAAVIVVCVVLLCALMGYTVRLPGVPEDEPDDLSGSRGIPGTGPASTCGIFPALAGGPWRIQPALFCIRDSRPSRRDEGARDRYHRCRPFSGWTMVPVRTTLEWPGYPGNSAGS